LVSTLAIDWHVAKPYASDNEQRPLNQRSCYCVAIDAFAMQLCICLAFAHQSAALGVISIIPANQTQRIAELVQQAKEEPVCYVERKLWSNSKR